MSWASHNPELWNELCLNSILMKLQRHKGLTQPDNEIDKESLTHIRDTYEFYNVWLCLMDWAHEEIVAAEADHFSTLADARVE